METQQLVTIGKESQNAVINAALESIDLTQWFFTLKDEEYRACSSGHHGMVQGRLPDGKRVSVSVETIGGNFIVNSYIEDVSCRDQVRGVSDSVVKIGGPKSVYTLMVKTTWELRVVTVSPQSCMLTCSVTVQTADPRIVAMFQKNPKRANDPWQKHVIEETPYFAADIEKKARSGIFA
jgi:hypothetical protein